MFTPIGERGKLYRGLHKLRGTARRNGKMRSSRKGPDALESRIAEQREEEERKARRWL